MPISIRSWIRASAPYWVSTHRGIRCCSTRFCLPVSQWLNILPVPVPTSPVRPSVEPAAQVPLNVSALHGAGLTLVSSNPAATAESVADMRLASIYDSQGNAAAGAVAAARAETLDAATASKLRTAIGISVAVERP